MENKIWLILIFLSLVCRYTPVSTAQGSVVMVENYNGSISSPVLSSYSYLPISGDTSMIGDSSIPMQKTLRLYMANRIGSPTWASITGKPSFATVATSGVYSDLSGRPTIPSQFSPTAGTNIAITGSYPNNTISTSGLSTVATTGSYTDLLNKPAISWSDIGTATRSFNSAFQVSSTNDAMVSYSISVGVVSALAGANTGTISIQTSPTSGGTYTTKAVGFSSIVGVLSTNANGGPLTVFVPKGYYVKLTTATTGANVATFSLIGIQELVQQ